MNHNWLTKLNKLYSALLPAGDRELEETTVSENEEERN